jgi:hypothetical protein
MSCSIVCIGICESHAFASAVENSRICTCSSSLPYFARIAVATEFAAAVVGGLRNLREMRRAPDLEWNAMRHEDSKSTLECDDWEPRNPIALGFEHRTSLDDFLGRFPWMTPTVEHVHMSRTRIVDRYEEPSHHRKPQVIPWSRRRDEACATAYINSHLDLSSSLFS